MSYEVLARKYRPALFAEVVGQDHILQALQNSLISGNLHQAFIFSGTRGVGKTTIARILAKALNCHNRDEESEPCDTCSACEEIKSGHHLEFIEVDAASRTGVDDMRDLLESAVYKPANANYKIYLIDEVHMLSKSSFNALLKTLEEPPPHMIFLMATTELDKVPKTVLSRCLQLNLKAVAQTQIANHMNTILDKEGIQYDPATTQLIAQSAQGSVRDGLTLLDQAIAFGAGKLETSQVKELLGTIDDVYLFELVEHILAGNGEGAHHSLQRILELQVDYQKVIEALIDLMHQLSMTQQLGSEDEDLVRLANSVDGELLQLLYQIAINALEKFSVHPSSYQAVEMCVLRMLTFHPLNESKPQINEKKNSKSQIKADVSKPPQKKVKEEVKVQQPDKKIKAPATNGKAASVESLSISDWAKDFEQLGLNGICYQLFSELEFKEAIGNRLVLVKPKNFSSPTSALLEEFSDKCREHFKVRPEVVIEEGNVTSSPSLIKEKIANQNLQSTIEELENQPIISEILKSFDGTIEPDSISTKE